MKIGMMAFLIAAACIGTAFSQTVYDKCVEECMKMTAESLNCYYDACNPADTQRIVTEGQGNPLQLFSYQLVGPAPVINGSLMSRNLNPNITDDKGEWKSACSRTLMLNDSGVVQLFLVNTADTLYVGITYEHGNNSDGSGVLLYFDEGAGSPPAALDGPGDMKLFSPNGLSNEQACAVSKSGGGILVRDMSWNGSAWANDSDGALDFRAARAYFASDLKVHHTEMAIPLNNGKTDNGGNSDLNVSPDDAIGFFLQVVKMGAGAGTFSWIETNNNVTRPDTFPYWGKIQLNVKREFFTFYTGGGSTPVLDGSIQEAAWKGAYERDLSLSNFHYGDLPAHIWCMEDSAQDYIYVGVRVFDHQQNPGDYCQVYFEETGENTTDSVRDYDLDGNAENSLRITLDSTFTDLYWNTDQGQWVADPEAADQQAARGAGHAGYEDFEFKVARSGGAYDIDIPKNGLMGFMLRYHDADRTAAERGEFYWEFTTNNDAQLLDQQTKPYVYIATGWANLQLGGPSIEIIAPTDSQILIGSVPVECLVKNGTPSQVLCFLSTDSTLKSTLASQGGGSWKGTVNVSNAPSGAAYLVVRVVTADSRVYERVVRVFVNYIAVETPKIRASAVFGLAQNSPNPFGAATAIRFSVRDGAGPQGVKIQVFDLNGKLVRTLVKGALTGGDHRVGFDGRNDLGNPLPAGVYFYRMTSRPFSETRKMLMFSK